MVDSLLQCSIILACTQQELHGSFIFGMAYSSKDSEFDKAGKVFLTRVVNYFRDSLGKISEPCINYMQYP